MHYISDHCYKLWTWLLADNASRATIILVFITALYVFLTFHMTKAIARQTRAMVQPVALLAFHWKEERYYPVGYFEIKNLGTQPLLLLDIKLRCHDGGTGKDFLEHYTLWDEHIIPPGESLQPQFDFKRELERTKLSWDSGWLSYVLEVVTSDLSKQVFLTYLNIPVLSVANVHKGMPLSVRWRYLIRPFKWRFHRLKFVIERMKTKR